MDVWTRVRSPTLCNKCFVEVHVISKITVVLVRFMYT